MRAFIYGVQTLDFTSKDGNKIQGKNIFCGFTHRFVDGLKTGKFYIPIDDPEYENIKPDIEVDISFDMDGKVDNISIL